MSTWKTLPPVQLILQEWQTVAGILSVGEAVQRTLAEWRGMDSRLQEQTYRMDGTASVQKSSKALYSLDSSRLLSPLEGRTCLWSQLLDSLLERAATRALLLPLEELPLFRELSFGVLSVL